MKIGAAHRNVRSASLKKIFLFCPPIGDVKLSLLFLHELSAKDHFHSFTSPIGGQNKIFIKKKRTEHFDAPRLFSYQSPINWALQRGNGNILKKRRRQH